MSKTILQGALLTCILMIAGGLFSAANGQALPDAEQDFRGYSNMNDGTDRRVSPDGFFILNSSNNGDLDADDFGAFFINHVHSETLWIEVLVNPASDLGSFQMQSLFVGEYDYGGVDKIRYENVVISAYQGETVVAETEPFSSQSDDEEANYPIDYSVFDGLEIDRFRVTFTVGPDTPLDTFNLVSFTIENASTEEPTPSFSLPTVSISSVSSITATGATLSGEVTYDGGDTVTERGFVYSTSSNPITSDTKVQSGSGTGAFSEEITSLDPETTYYVRAYAINGVGTSYGSEQSFTTLTIFAGGSGTEADPYQVETAEQLDSVRDYLDSHFIQTADIDLGVSPWNDGEGWEPLVGECIQQDFFGNCTGYESFTGLYDGDGYEISNLFIDRDSQNNVGLFSITGGTIKNLQLVNVVIKGGNTVGAIAGRIVSGNYSNLYVHGDIEGVRYVGGLFGQLYNSLVAEVFGEVSVTKVGTDGTIGDIGGVFGMSSDAIINNSYVTGTLTASGGRDIGGFGGRYVAHGSAQNNQLTNNYSAIEIDSDGTNIGGFLGNAVEVNGTLQNEGNFWDLDVSGQTNSAIGTGIFTSEMKTKSTFTDAGWDFDTVWQIEEPSSGSISYPYLQSNAQFPAPGYFEPQIPDVVTRSTIDNISSGSAEVSGEVIDDKGIEVTDRGFVYRTSPNPTTDDNKIQAGGGTGEFTETISGLNPGITYYVRAYAINADGTAYGTEQSFTTIPVFAAGTGTEAEPYEVETAEQLDAVRDYLDAHYIQTADIDLGVSPWNDASGWEPIGGNGNAFTGTFDGQGHTISGLTINRSTDYIGLFGYTNTGAIIRNLGLIDVSIRGRNTVGGLVGYLLDGTVSNSYVKGKVNQNTNSGNDIGGLVGSSTGTITDSYVNVIVGGSSHVGGLAGRNGGAIEGSYALGSLLGSNRLGGFVGSNDGTGTISNSYSSVDVTSNQFNQNIFGGLVGQNFGAISNSYASGIMVVNQNGAGGLVGTGSGAVNGSFWDTETTGQINSAGGTGKTTAEMRTRSTFTDADWDFDDVWQIVETSTSFSSPYLSGNEQNPAPGYLELTPPAITTQENLVNLTSESVDVTGQVTDDGNVEITHRGFVWATDAAPDDTTIVWSGSGDDTFTETISDLPPATALNVRSFATNMIGTAYGNLVSFETEPGELLLTGSFTVQDKVYEGETAAMIDQNSLTLDGVYDGHDVQIGTLVIAFTDVNAGVDQQVSIQSVTLSGQDADRYTISLTNAPHSVADITERPITVSAGAQQVTYGDDDPTLTYEITTGSLVDGDGLSGELNRTVGQDVGTYTIEQGDLTAGSNYDLSFVEADLEITPRVLAITANADQAKTYGEADPSFTYEAANFGWSDSETLITGALDREAGENVGQFAMGQGNLDAGENYTIDYTPADFAITSKELLVVADGGQKKVYGENDPVLTFAVSGFEFTDDEKVFSGALSRESGEDVGEYSITTGSLSAGDNYTITFESNPFTITPKVLAVSAAAGQEKVYGETDGDLSFTASGFAHGDQYEIFSGALSRETGEDAGEYSIKAGNLDAGENYTIDFESDTFEILKRTLTVSADRDQHKTFGDDDPLFTFTADNFGLNDGIELFTGALTREGGESTGTFELFLGTLDAGSNYEIDFESALFEIKARSLQISAAAGSKLYGDADPELSFIAEGFRFGDDESILSGKLYREAGQEAGTYTILGDNLLVSDDYTIEYSAADFTINPKQLKITADDGQSKIMGENDPVFAYSAEGFAFDDGTDLLKGALSREAGEESGSYSITIGTLDAGSNYTIKFIEKDFTILMPPPVADLLSPVDGSKQVATNADIIIEFDQDVSLDDAGRVELISGGDERTELTASVTGNQLKLTHDGLTHNTEYTLNLNSGAVQNVDGVPNQAAEFSFTTIMAVPEPVVLVSPFDGSGSVSLSPELTWEESDHADYYRVELSSDSGFDELLEYSDGVQSLSHSIRDLEYYSGYFWRVRAINTAGSSDWSETGEFYTIAETPRALFPADGSGRISTAPVLEWTSRYETTFRVQLSESEAFSELLSDTLKSTSAFQITGLDADRDYFWRVRVESEVTSSEWLSPQQFRTRPAPREEEGEHIVESTVHFGGTSSRENRQISQMDYRMIGLPGTNQHELSEFFKGQYGTEWKAFLENGADDFYYDEFDPDDDRFRFLPGRGFWVLSTDQLNFGLEIDPVETNEHDAYRIPVHPGWNIISNPHRGSVSWEEVQELNGTGMELYGYDQRFLPADSLHAVHGYYIYNDPNQSLSYIEIPYTNMGQRRGENGLAAQEALKLQSLEATPASAKITAAFENGIDLDAELIYSVSSGNEGRYLRHYPSLEMSKTGMMFTDSSIRRGGLVRGESVYNREGGRYSLELKGRVGDSFTWKANLSGLGDQARILVVNPVTNLSWLLSDGEEAQTTLSEPHGTYEVYIGEESYLSDKQQEMMPVILTLEQNYPNPFNPTTNIRFALPDQQHVSLEVYDVIGRRVQVLHDNVLEAGWHNAQFDGRRLASGVYFYRLHTGGMVKTGRMTLIK